MRVTSPSPSLSMPNVRPVIRQQATQSFGISGKASSSLMPRLMMSDYWFLAGLMLALIYIADPFMLRLDKLGPTKHLPLIISLFGVVLANMGNWLFRPINRVPLKPWQVLGSGLPLIFLALWIVFGSIFARNYYGTNNTFVIVGLYMLFTFLAARVVMLSPARARIVRAYLLAAAAAGVFMVVRMAVSYGNQEVSYHEMEALVIPLAAYFALRPMRNRHWQAFLILFFLAAGLVFRKNTGFLVLVMTLLYIWIAEWRFRFRESATFRFWALLWLMLMFMVGIAAAGYFAHQRGELMPSGNPQYRMLTYEVAWNKFLDSPIWGTGFTKPATEKFTAYAINAAKGVLPTHSDILDLAAQGGVIALFLWLWGYLRITTISIHALKGARPRDDTRAAAHALACMSLTSIIVYAFNPILLQPAKALLVWSQFGMLLGVALYLANNPSTPTSSSTTMETNMPTTRVK